MVVGDEVEQVYVGDIGRPSVLLAEAERRVRHSGHDTAWLAVVAGNERARRFYAKRGWVDAGARYYQAHGPEAHQAPSHRYAKAV